MRTLLALLTSLILFAFAPITKIDSVKFLTGTWKTENKEEFETWKVVGDLMEGNSYNMRSGKQTISEYLSIKSVKGNLVYTAKVLNQNNGQPINFTLNNNVKGKLSFENLEHDFPKKIQYTKLNDTTVFVEVLGKDNKGFSYKMMRSR